MSSVLQVTDIITEPQDAAQYVFDLLKQKQEPLGIGFLGLNERLRPEYPAVMIYAGRKEKVQHGTHKFLVGLEVSLMVYHAKLDTSHTQRTKEDLDLVTAIENTIEATSDTMTFGGRVIFAYVAEAFPLTAASRVIGTQVVGTQMTILVESRKGFPYGP